MKLTAFTRNISPAIERCELSHLDRMPIDLALARSQHHAFEQVLASRGCQVRHLPDLPDLPDAVFVQDAAIVFDEVAIIARPGAESRRPETPSVAASLADFRPLRFIEAPGTLDGGDVLTLGRNVYVGQSARTNADGIRQLGEILRPFGYTVRGVPITGCLHLQSAATPVADDLLLVNRRWVDPAEFGDIELVDIDPEEPFAANALLVGDAVVHPDMFSRTQSRLEARGIRVVPVDLSELAKAEGGVTCCSILLAAPGRISGVHL
jgi:dimethylargininase